MKLLNIFGGRRQFTYQNHKGELWYLFSKNVYLRGGKPVRIYFFNKNPNANVGTGRKEYAMPAGYTIRENPRNGVPTLTRNYERGDDEQSD